jgi:hypothetical protein
VGEAGIEPDPQPRAREPRPQFGDETMQQAANAPGRGARARPQEGRDEELVALVVEGHGGEQRQIAPGVVEAVEERELLVTAFSKRESVGCDPSASPVSGSRPSTTLWIGPLAKRAASLQSA